MLKRFLRTGDEVTPRLIAHLSARVPKTKKLPFDLLCDEKDQSVSDRTKPDTGTNEIRN